MNDVKKVITNILYRASVDKEFRDVCLKDGNLVFSSFFNSEFTKNKSVKFIENENKDKDFKLDGNDIVFVLPNFVGVLNKLSKDDLEVVTGGVIEFINLEENNISLKRLLSA